MRSVYCWNRSMNEPDTLFDAAAGNDEVRKAYAVMQTQYVLRPEDRIEYDAAMTALSKIHDRLMQSREWTMYEPGEELLRHIRQQEEERLRPVPSQRKQAPSPSSPESS